MHLTIFTLNSSLSNSKCSCWAVKKSRIWCKETVWTKGIKSIKKWTDWLATWTTMIGPSLPVRDCPLSYKRAMFAIYRHENLPGIQLMNTYLTCDSPLRDRRAMFCCTLYQSSNFVIELSHFVLTLLAFLIKKNCPEDFIWGDWETSISPNKPVSLQKNLPSTPLLPHNNSKQ